jgi:hypothetical protein
MGAADRKPFELPPGVAHPANHATVGGRWNEVNLIRWVEGEMRPVGGWEKLSLPTPESTIRCIHTWQSLDGSTYTGVLCVGHAYVIKDDGTMINISPEPPLVTNAANTTTGGFGDAEYGTQNYGDPRIEVIKSKPVGPTYTMENWGEDLIFCTSVDGRLLRWKPSTPDAVAAKVPNAPIGIRTFVVTPERHVIVFGFGGDLSTWGWCDQEDIENWNFADPLSTAGTYNIEPAAPIIAATTMVNGVMMFTPVGVYISRYVSLPYIYSNAIKIADNACPISAQSVANVSNLVIWWAEDGFWKSDGNTVTPMECPVYDWAINLANNRTLRWRTVSVSLGFFPEVWWFFPVGEETENSRYICYDVFRGWWAMGKLARTCGHSGAYTTYPYMSDGTSLYIHEKGMYYYDAPELPYATTGVINLGKGQTEITIKQMIVDIDTTPNTVLFDFYAKSSRLDSEPGQSKMGLKVRPDGYLDIRITGRDHWFTVRSAYNGSGYWSMGQPLIETAIRGGR